MQNEYKPKINAERRYLQEKFAKTQDNGFYAEKIYCSVLTMGVLFSFRPLLFFLRAI